METDGRKISICYTTYNRVEELMDSMEKVYDDERIDEIVVSDDFSELEHYEMLKQYFEYMPKVRLHRNEKNMDCYKNKKVAVSLAKNDWLCLWDSDNDFGVDYLDAIFSIPKWEDDIVYTPSFAKPAFDFRQYDNVVLSKENVSKYIDLPMLEVCLNACNYFVNKNSYINVFDDNADPVTSDSIFQCYNLLRHGRKIKIVQGLEYFHNIHDGSHYKNNVYRTPVGFHESLLQKIRELK